MKFPILLIIILSLIGLVGPQIAQSQLTYQLQYALGYRGTLAPGSSVVLVNNFTNAGDVQLRVNGVSVVIDFGTFTGSSGLPISLAVGEKKTYEFTILIPSSASSGSHTVSATATFQYYDSGGSQWISVNPLTIQGTLSLQQVSGSGLLTTAAVGGILGAIIAVAIALVVRRRRKKPEAMPPGPAPQSPASPASP